MTAAAAHFLSGFSSSQPPSLRIVSRKTTKFPDVGFRCHTEPPFPFRVPSSSPAGRDGDLDHMVLLRFKQPVSLERVVEREPGG